MRPPIWRGRPQHPDDLDETKELHAAEIAMDRDLDDPRGHSRVRTVLYDVGETVHQGRLGAAIHTLRLVSSSVRRLIGRFGLAEDRMDVHQSRIEVVEWTLVLLLGLVGLALWSAGLAVIAVVAARVYLWLAP